MFLALDNPGVFPSKKYFFEKGASPKEKIMNRVEETYNTNLASISHLFSFPSIEEFKEIEKDLPEIYIY